MKKRITLKQITESGILLALGFILSLLKVELFPNGGSVTATSMLPIVVLAFKYGPAWGGLCGFVHSILQMVEGRGIPAPPAKDFASYLLVILLDFFLAWAIVGVIAGLFRSLHTKSAVCIAAGAFFGIAGRFLCHFLSGIVIWGVYAPQGQGAAAYSLIYNATYMVPEMVFTAVAGFALFSVPVIQKQAART